MAKFIFLFLFILQTFTPFITSPIAFHSLDQVTSAVQTESLEFEKNITDLLEESDEKVSFHSVLTCSDLKPVESFFYQSPESRSVEKAQTYAAQIERPPKAECILVSGITA